MIRDGIVKVLDFGLAKLTALDANDLETREHTAPHRVMDQVTNSLTVSPTYIQFAHR